MTGCNTSVTGYDRLAKHYRLLERCLFGEKLQRSRLTLLSELPSCDSVLILGDGDGRLLEAFCRSQEECQVTSLDQSGRMLEIQRQKVQNQEETSSSRFKFLQEDARDYRPNLGNHDLLVTAYFLDCFTEEELAQCLPHWLAGVKDRGLLYVVDFYQPRKGWNRLRGSFLLWLMHRFFCWQTDLPNRRLVDLNAALKRLPLEPLHDVAFDGGLIRAQLFRVHHTDALTKY